jgi:hypothetical protein
VTWRDAYRFALILFLGATFTVAMWNGFDEDHAAVIWSTGAVFGACAMAILYELNRDRSR